jgi:hypothetical protein
MTEMNPIAISVLDKLRVQTPEVLYLMYQHELLDTWTDTGTFVSTPEQFTSAFRRLEFLTSLYDDIWAQLQYRKVHNLLKTNPDVFKKQRAPEGMAQWEFDLLN